MTTHTQVTTVATTPLAKWLYPVWYQNKMAKWRRGETDKDGNPIASPSSTDDADAEDAARKLNSAEIRRLLVYLRLDSLPSLFTLVALLGAHKKDGQDATTAAAQDDKDTSNSLEAPPARNGGVQRRPLEVHGLRMLELTERTSSVMQVTEGEEYYSERDPVVNAFRTFSRLNDVAVSGRVAIVPTASYADTLMKQASEIASDFVLVPWSEFGSISEETSVLDVLPSAHERFTGRAHLEFVNHVLAANSICNTGIFINNGLGGAGEKRPLLKRTKSALSVHSQKGDPATLPIKDKSHQLFVPFLGGVDDRVALRFALRLAQNPNATLTVAYFTWASAHDSGDDVSIPSKAYDGRGVSPEGKGVHVRAAAEEEEEEMDEKAAAAAAAEGPTPRDLALLSALQHSQPTNLQGRVTVIEVHVTRGTAVAEAVAKAKTIVGAHPKNSGDIVVVGRTHAALGEDTSVTEIGGNELAKTVGLVGERLVSGGVKASLLVIKAGGAGLHW